MMSPVKTKRPVNLKLSTLHFPPMAIVSILHRLTGVAIFMLMPWMFYWLYLSLHSAETFQDMHNGLHCGWVKLSIWIFSTAFAYHGLAGVRHLLSDLGIGEQLSCARWSAYGLLFVTLVIAVFLGRVIW